MSNRLEQEFPAVRWQAVPPREAEHARLRGYVERGRRLRSEAIGRGGRAGLAALAQAVHRVVTFVRCTTRSLSGRAAAGDCWARSARRA